MAEFLLLLVALHPTFRYRMLSSNVYNMGRRGVCLKNVKFYLCAIVFYCMFFAYKSGTFGTTFTIIACTDFSLRSSSGSTVESEKISRIFRYKGKLCTFLAPSQEPNQRTSLARLARVACPINIFGSPLTQTLWNAPNKVTLQFIWYTRTRAYANRSGFQQTALYISFTITKQRAEGRRRNCRKISFLNETN